MKPRHAETTNGMKGERIIGRLKSRVLRVTVLIVGLIAGLALSGPAPAATQTLDDSKLIEKELRCSKRLKTPGYYSSLNAAEVADAQRSQLYPCADFLGSWTGANKVSARMSEDSYQGASFLNNREPGELYLVGGDQPPAKGPVPPGPYVAKVDPTTGAQIWRTVLDDANVTGHWIAVANLNILRTATLCSRGTTSSCC
jgi:hypothetical protein